MARQDDFSADVKELLAKRVGVRCSNPNCRQGTSGPAADPKKSLNIGVAAHITAASPGGARYDEALTSDERRGPDNGIWCCQNCAKLVDNDAAVYTVDLLKRWKSWSEEAARLLIDSPLKESSQAVPDEDLIRFYMQCFDRPAFQDQFVQEGSMPAFDQAIEDTIIAINTGCLRARDGQILFQSKGKAFLQRADWRMQMDAIVDLLRAVRARYELGKKLGLIHSWESAHGEHFHCINDLRTAEWMDETREEVLRMFGQVAEQAGVGKPQSRFSRRRHR